MPSFSQHSIWTRVHTVLAWSLIVLALPAVARGGQQAAAGIIGQVRDESGAVLPGVSVTAKSPSLQIAEMATVTDAQGEYRVSPLPIGVYTVEYALSGFETIRREALRLTVGFVAKIDLVMKVGSLSETITVSGQAPVVDVTQTSASTQFTRETLDILPGSRTGMNSLIAMAPGARSTWDVGGSAATEQPNFRAFGQGGEPWSTVEGVVTGAFAAGNNGIGNYSDYNAYEEARVATIGNGADMPTRGMQVVAVVKSGGNQFHGGGFVTRDPTGLVAENIDADLLKYSGINSGLPLKKRYDSGADGGGRIVRNKVWWYGALRRRRDIKYENSGVKDDGSPAENNQLAWSHTEKLSYQMSNANKLIGFNQYNHKWDVSEASALRAWEAKSNKPTMTNIAKIEWQTIVGSSFVASLQTGYFRYQTPYYDNTTGPYGTDVRPGPSYTDLFTGYTGGEFTNTGRRASERSYQTVGGATFYRPDLFLGNHQFKAGFEYLDVVSEAAYVARQSGNYQLVFNNGAATQLRAWVVPTTPHDVAHHLGVYVADSWTVARRLTLNLGLRSAHNPGFIPADCRPKTDFGAATCHDRIAFRTFNSVVPRIHASLDVTGNGHNVIKGGWGRFPHMLYVGEVAAADPFTRTQITYRWRDLNNNRNYDPGEVNLDVNGPDFVSVSGGTNTIPNSKLKQPMYDEFSASYERQLMTDWGVRFTGIHSKTHDPYRSTNLLRPPSVYTIPVTRPDPGPDGLPGTADDPGRSFTYYEYAPALRGAAFIQNTTVNADADVHFTSFEVAASKRLSNKWMLITSYSATRRHVPFINGLDPGEQGTSVQLAVNTPNDEINASDSTVERTFKLAGAYVFPWDVMVSLNDEWRSGEAWARQVLFTGGNTIPNIVLRVEPIGSQHLPGRNLVNLSLQKSLRLTRTQKLDLRANIFNLVNANTIMEVTKQSGPSYQVPTPAASYPAVMAPRIVEFGATFSF